MQNFNWTMHQSDQKLIKLLHEKGLKATPQRLAIFRYLDSNDSHPSAEMILEDIKQELPTISQGTVYNTLSVFTDIGVIRELKLETGHSRYDTNTDVHVNIICPICNHISDYQTKDIIDFWERISNDIGGEIAGQRFDVYKICRTCS